MPSHFDKSNKQILAEGRKPSGSSSVEVNAQEEPEGFRPAAKKLVVCVGLVVAMLSVHSLVAQESTMRLRLKDSSYAIGEIRPSEFANHIGFHCDGFDEQFDIDIAAVRSITGTQPFVDQEPAVANQGNFQFEFGKNNRVVGQLLSFDDQLCRVQSEALGTIAISRTSLTSISAIDSPQKVITPGINDDGSWCALNNATNWTINGEVLNLPEPGLTVCGDVRLNQMSQIDLELSWTGEPNFIVSLGTKTIEVGQKSLEEGATSKLEVWDKQLVLVREAGGQADVTMLDDLASRESHIELMIFLDQDAGLVAVRKDRQSETETLTLKALRPQTLPAIAITNQGPSLTVEKLVVRNWDGNVPKSITDGESNLLSRAGAEIDGSIESFSSESQALVVATSTGEMIRLPMAELSIARMLNASKHLASNENDKFNPTVRDQSEATIVFNDSASLTGKLMPIEKRAFGLKVSGISEPIQFDVKDINSAFGNSAAFLPKIDGKKLGTLTIGDTQLSGSLLTENFNAPKTGLYWLPVASRTASQISASASGSIVFRNLSMVGNRSRVLPQSSLPLAQSLRRLDYAPSNGQVRPFRSNIEFRNGDQIDAELTGINETGVRFTSSQTQKSFMPHDKIDHVWLQQQRGDKKLSNEKRERLLTVPRSLKDDPPTHLIVAVSGDFLRGRLISCNENSLSVELRSGVVNIELSEVAEIIWLHRPDWQNTNPIDGDVAKPIDDVEAEKTNFEVFTKSFGGQVLTLFPNGVDQGMLQGQNELLGMTSVDLTNVEHLLFGSDVAQQRSRFEAEPWKLSLATYPKVFRDAEGHAADSNLVQSPLAGKSAPDFVGLNLDGQRTQLSELRGKVVVLDFWASWCGPCMHTMPKVYELIQEIGGGQIEMVAVNIQETEAKVRLGLERLKIDCTTLLDSDGQIAAAYEVLAIPQTVVIDRDGIVMRIYVGDTPNFLDELESTLRQSIESNPIEANEQ